MKINVPITEEQHKIADLEYAELVKRQRKAFYSIADKLIAHELLTSYEAEIAAAIIKAHAARMSEVRPRNPGKPARLPGELVVEYGMLIVFDNLSQNAALERLSEKYQVSETAIKKHLGLIGKTKEAYSKKQETINIISEMQHSQNKS